MSLTGISTKSGKEKYLEKFARLGLSAKGLVYCLVAILTFIAALGIGRQNGDQKEVFKIIHHQVFGEVLLSIVGISLLGYVTLRFFQAFQDSNDQGKGLKGILRRTGYFISGLIHIGFSYYAFKIAFDYDPEEGDSKEKYTGKVMQFPGGQLVIGIIAAIVIGNGIYQIYRGISTRFMKRVELYHSNFSGTFKKIGIIGLSSRGLVLCIIGYFLLRAAWFANPKEADGTKEAFDFLEDNFGSALVLVVALGLFTYGLFMFVRARHERIRLKL